MSRAASRRLALLVALAVFVLAGGSFVEAQSQPSQAQPPQHHAKAEVKYESRQTLPGGVTLAQLSSGLTVIVRENHAAPVATVRVYVKNTGSAYEARFLGTGVSHMLEHLVAGGSTTKRKEKDIQDLIDSLGGRTNAFTSHELTAYYIDCPAHGTNLAIDLMAEAMQFALIPQDEYVREMGVVQRELEMGKADRTRERYQAIKSLVFTEHPVRHPIIGYLPVVQSVKREEVIEFYKERYVPQNMTFLIVGDVDTEKALEQVLRNVKEFQRTTERIATLGDEPEQASPRSTRMEMEGETTIYSIAWPTVRLQHADLYALDVAADLLTNGDSSRLTKRLKIDQPLAVSVDSASYTPGFVKGWFEVSVDAKPENIEACRKAIQQEIARLQRDLVGPDELAKVKRQKSAEHVFGQQTVQAQADALGRSYLATGDPLFDEHYVKGIQRVTAEQVQQVARKYFRPERENIVYVEPIGSGKQRAAEVASSSVESPVLRKQLSNGMTVLVKRHAVLPMVTLQAFVKGGIISDTHETSGLAALSTELMTRGTEKYTGDQIAEYFDSIGGSIGVDSQRNTSYLQCLVLKDDFVTALDYAHQVLLKPTFPAAEFAKVKELQLGRIAARKAEPRAEIMDYWSTLLPRSSPFSRTILGTTETVSKLTAGDCRRFHQSFVVPNNMVLAVYGDVDPNETLALLERTFGQTPSQPSFRFPTFEASHTSKAASTSHLTNQRPNTAMVLLSFPTVNVREVETRATFEVINAVLTGGSGAGGRLFEELRGQRLVYYVFGQEMTGLPPGYFVFLAQTRPETAAEVVERILANLDKLRREGLTANELARTKQKLLAAHLQSNVTPTSQAFQACIDELYGLGYDHDKTYEQRLNKVTVDDIKAVMNRYFVNPQVVTSSPEAAPTIKSLGR